MNISRAEKTRKEKIKLLHDIAQGNISIDDLLPCSIIVHCRNNDHYYYNGKLITKEQADNMRGKKLTINRFIVSVNDMGTVKAINELSKD